MYQRKKAFLCFLYVYWMIFSYVEIVVGKKVVFLDLDLCIMWPSYIQFSNNICLEYIYQYMVEGITSAEHLLICTCNDQDFGNTIIFLKVILKDNFPCWIFDLVGHQFNCLCQIRICSYTIQNDVNDLISPSFNNFCCQGYEKLQ